MCTLGVNRMNFDWFFGKKPFTPPPSPPRSNPITASSSSHSMNMNNLYNQLASRARKCSTANISKSHNQSSSSSSLSFESMKSFVSSTPPSSSKSSIHTINLQYELAIHLLEYIKAIEKEIDTIKSDNDRLGKLQENQSTEIYNLAHLNKKLERRNLELKASISTLEFALLSKNQLTRQNDSNDYSQSFQSSSLDSLPLDSLNSHSKSISHSKSHSNQHLHSKSHLHSNQHLHSNNSSIAHSTTVFIMEEMKRENRELKKDAESIHTILNNYQRMFIRLKRDFPQIAEQVCMHTEGNSANNDSHQQHSNENNYNHGDYNNNANNREMKNDNAENGNSTKDYNNNELENLLNQIEEIEDEI